MLVSLLVVGCAKQPAKDCRRRRLRNPLRQSPTLRRPRRKNRPPRKAEPAPADDPDAVAAIEKIGGKLTQDAATRSRASTFNDQRQRL